MCRKVSLNILLMQTKYWAENSGCLKAALGTELFDTRWMQAYKTLTWFINILSLPWEADAFSKMKVF